MQQLWRRLLHWNVLRPVARFEFSHRFYTDYWYRKNLFLTDFQNVGMTSQFRATRSLSQMQTRTFCLSFCLSFVLHCQIYSNPGNMVTCWLYPNHMSELPQFLPHLCLDGMHKVVVPKHSGVHRFACESKFLFFFTQLFKLTSVFPQVWHFIEAFSDNVLLRRVMHHG